MRKQRILSYLRNNWDQAAVPSIFVIMVIRDGALVGEYLRPEFDKILILNNLIGSK
jgi:hypothetical protein